MKHFLFSIAILVMTFRAATAQTPHKIFVNINSPASLFTQDGSSWTKAYSDFQVGVNSAAAGDTVFVAAGIYTAPLGSSFSMKAGVKIYGGCAGNESNLAQRIITVSDSSILKGNGSSVINNNGSLLGALDASALLDGFTITGGNAATGGGICNTGCSPAINNCIIKNNSATPGLGTTAYGAGIYNGLLAAPTITNCIFSNNTVSSATLGYGGGGICNTAVSVIPTISNCLFINNTVNGAAGTGGAILDALSALATIDNCTFINNITTTGNGSAIASSNLDFITNSIIWDLSGTGNAISYPVSVLTYWLNVNNCLIHGLAATGTNLDGTSFIPSQLFIDSANNNFNLKAGCIAVNVGTNVLSILRVSLPLVDLAGNPRIAGGIVDLGCYEQTPKRIYVNANVTGLANGSSFANGFTDLQAAINLATPGDSIFVAAGTYIPLPGTSFSMSEGVKIYGGFAGTETCLAQRNLALPNTCVLEGNGNSVINNTLNNLTTASVLDGFTISGGNTIANGGGMCNAGSSPTISNCIFKNNIAADFGGAISNLNAVPILLNCLFVDNSAGDGGCMYNDNSSPHIINCTASNNSGSACGGILNINASDPTIINTIIWGNILAGIQNLTGSLPNINFCLIQGLPLDAVKHNLDGTTNPLFADTTHGNYSLIPGSSAINAGTVSIPGLITPVLDMLGITRVRGGIIDLGPFENPSSTLPVSLINFYGNINNGIAGLQWQTGVELNVSSFDVQKSTDEIYFETIANVLPKGSNSIYFNSVQQAEPNVYYRLKIVDMNGAITYSKEVHLSQAKAVSISVYPNPATAIVYVEGNATDLQQVHLINTTEQDVTNNVSISGNNTNMLKINMLNLASGIYFIKTTTGTYKIFKR